MHGLVGVVAPPGRGAAQSDARPSADNDIFANHSSNSGDTWNAADTRLDSTPSMSNSAAMLPAVASDGTGRVFAAWMDERDGRQDIYANCSADHGATWRVNDVRLDTNTSAGSAASFVPRVCTDGSGCVYVAWTEMGNGSNPSVYFNKSCDLCSTWLASPVRVDHAGTQASMINPAFLSCDASGNVYLGWSDDRVTGSGSDQDMDAYVNVSHDRGSTWQFPTDTKVNGTGVSGAWLDGMTSDASGHVYVLFNAANGPLGTWHYYVNRSWDAGNTWRGAIDLAGGIVGAPPNGTTIAADNSGGAYIAWFDARNGAYDVFVRRSVTNGDPPWSTDQRLDGDALGANSSFNVVMAADAGNVLVTWTDDRTGKDQVFANRSTDQGATWLASAVQVDTGDAPGAHQSAMTEGFIVPTVALRGNNARVTWVDNRNSCGGKPGFDTYVNYSENAGQSWHAASIRVEAGDGPGCSDAAWPALSFSADRWTHVAWVDHRMHDRALPAKLDGHGGLLAHLHDRALAELLLDPGEGHLECLVTLHRRRSFRVPQRRCWGLPLRQRGDVRTIRRGSDNQAAEAAGLGRTGDAGTTRMVFRTAPATIPGFPDSRLP